MEDLVTVIIPVYNAECYLSKCIESVLNQIYKNLEIIIIDDGSTDRSAVICCEYAECDNRIKFIQQENRGVSFTRNLGIDCASGKYICFIDSDDYVEKEYVSFMVSMLKTENADLCTCSLWFEYVEGKWKGKTLNEKDKCLDKSGGLISLFSRKGMFGGPVCKLYKTDILNKHHIRFNENIRICEDNLFCYEYIRKCDRVFDSSKCLYYYKFNKDSASNKKYIPESLEDSQLHFRAYREIEKTINYEEQRVIKYYLTMMAGKCIRLTYKYNLFKYLPKGDIQYIRKCVKEAYQEGERSELRVKKGSYIMGWVIIINPMLAKWLCETRRLYKKKI